MKLFLNGNYYAMKKAQYVNGRLAIVLFGEDVDTYIPLTVNIPNARMFCDVSDEGSSNASFINHIDGISYDYLLRELLRQNIIEDNVGNVKSGFNHYIAFTFNENVVKNMEAVIGV